MLDVKYSHKASYRINSRIKNIIDNTARDIRRKTGLKLSLGKLSRAFWISLEENPALRKKFIDTACKTILESADTKYGKYYYVNQKKHGNTRRNSQ